MLIFYLSLHILLGREIFGNDLKGKVIYDKLLGLNNFK